MTDQRRHTLIVALVAAFAGAGLGIEVAQGGGLVVGANLGLWAAALAGGALLVLFFTAPEARADEGERAVESAREAGWAEFRRELRRSRRASRSMTLLRIPGDASSDATSLATRAHRLAGHLRLVDRVWVDDGSCYVLLPESTRDAAATLLQRIGASEPTLVAAEVRAATFPEDGLTSGAIISALHGTTIDEVPTPIRSAIVDESAEQDAADVREAAAR
jgi:hypothetical protein